MLGSLLPVWGGDFQIQYYLYTDSTGAQYRLDQSIGNGVYGSANSIRKLRPGRRASELNL